MSLQESIHELRALSEAPASGRNVQRPLNALAGKAMQVAKSSHGDFQQLWSRCNGLINSKEIQLLDPKTRAAVEATLSSLITIVNELNNLQSNAGMIKARLNEIPQLRVPPHD